MLLIKNKQVPWDSENNKLDKGYTTAELRWLYKNWEKIEGLKDKVVFYQKGEIVTAPWLGADADQKEWENYKKGSSYSIGQPTIHSNNLQKPKPKPKRLHFEAESLVEGKSYPQSLNKKARRGLFLGLESPINTLTNDALSSESNSNLPTLESNNNSLSSEKADKKLISKTARNRTLFFDKAVEDFSSKLQNSPHEKISIQPVDSIDTTNQNSFDNEIEERVETSDFKK